MFSLEYGGRLGILARRATLKEFDGQECPSYENFLRGGINHDVDQQMGASIGLTFLDSRELESARRLHGAADEG